MAKIFSCFKRSQLNNIFNRLRKLEKNPSDAMDLNYNWSIGEIYTSKDLDINKCRSVIPDFYKTLEKNGYKPRESRFYQSSELIIASGYIEFHVDNRSGLNALLFLDLKPFTRAYHHTIKYNSGELYSNQTMYTVQVGEIVVFNANSTHAWGSNGNAIFFAQTVSKFKTV